MGGLRKVRTLKGPKIRGTTPADFPAVGMMKKLLVLFVVVVLAAFITAIPALAGRPGHSVSVGGPDICEAFGLSPGCDKNFSLSAREMPDGSVKGQWDDQFGGGLGGFHADIDCLAVAVNEAWVSGQITHGVINDPDTGESSDLSGLSVSTKLQDNGNSANDPVDMISLSWIDDGNTCLDLVDYPLGQAPQGQVKVR